MNAAQDCRTDAELMSLGNINAGSVSFESNGRIVIDTERVRSEDNKKNDRFSVVTASDASRSAFSATTLTMEANQHLRRQRQDLCVMSR